MAYTRLRIVFIFLSIAIKLQHTFCDEHLQIDIRNDGPFVHSDFIYDEVITDDQIKLFQLDGDKAIDAWLKRFAARRPECAVLKGICRFGGTNHYVDWDGVNETTVHVRVAVKNVRMNYSKEAKKVQWLSEIYTNNGTNGTRWTPEKKFTHTTPVTRIHSEETTNAWSLGAAVNFLNVVTESGSFQLESKWSDDLKKMKSFQVQVIRSVPEVEVYPGESVRSCISYKEIPFTLELTYNMTIDFEYGGHMVVEFNNEPNSARTNEILAVSGKPTTYNHTVRLEFTVPVEIVQTIEMYKGVDVQWRC